MLTLAMILDNPGEQPHQTRYRDPNELRRLGYSDLIIYPTTGLSGLLGPDTVAAADLRRWVSQQYESVHQTATAAHAATMGAWVLYDSPSLARELVTPAMTCINQRPQVLCPASNELLELSGRCLEALLHRVDPIDGVVLRLGDNDASKLPYLVGNDVYSPHCARCSAMGRADRLVKFIKFFYDLVVTKLNRKLIIRAWNLRPGGMHDNPELCSRVVQQLPNDERLILSFKFTQTDFWRYQKWNQSSLVCNGRPIIYELQCQREFEGKGAIPDWQAPLWRNGMTEMDGPSGLADVASKVNLAGLWAWVRGGGWRGPYVSSDREWWIDANVVAVPQLAADPKADTDALAKAWIHDRLGCEDSHAAESILHTLQHSVETVLQTFYVGPYARRRKDPWHPGAHFMQDDLIDAEAAWSIVQQLPEADLDEVIAEKLAAEQRLAEDRNALLRVASKLSKPLSEALPLSLEYAETLTQTLRHLLAGLVAYRRWQRRADAATAQAALRSLRACQSCWVHHTQRVVSHGTASAFGSDNLWEFTQRIVDRLQDAPSRA
jgi:hypothetical protein